MPDNVSPEIRRKTMARVKSVDTAPEMKVRRAVHAAGYRYRLHRKELPGSPDLVFPRHRLVVFVNGCFWHWHGCPRSRMPATNRSYWQRKIDSNVARDKVAARNLTEMGWKVVVIWECELDAGLGQLLAQLSAETS